MHHLCNRTLKTGHPRPFLLQVVARTIGLDHSNTAPSQQVHTVCNILVAKVLQNPVSNSQQHPLNAMTGKRAPHSHIQYRVQYSGDNGVKLVSGIEKWCDWFGWRGRSCEERKRPLLAITPHCTSNTTSTCTSTLETSSAPVISPVLNRNMQGFQHTQPFLRRDQVTRAVQSCVVPIGSGHTPLPYFTVSSM